MEARPGALAVTWRYFSLHQINNRVPGWEIWEQPVDGVRDRYVEALRAFWAAEAARQQGDGAFWRYHRALLRAAHAENAELGDPAVLRSLAEQEGLDVARWQQDAADRSLLRRLQLDHTEAVEQFHVFGTPTFVFPDADPAYLKLTAIPAGDEAVRFWETFHTAVADMPYVLEIKRPQA